MQLGQSLPRHIRISSANHVTRYCVQIDLLLRIYRQFSPELVLNDRARVVSVVGCCVRDDVAAVELDDDGAQVAGSRHGGVAEVVVVVLQMSGSNCSTTAGL